MNAIAHNRPKVTEKDRITFTLFLSVLINCVIIFGIGFTLEDAFKSTPTPTLDVVVVEHNNSDKSEEADYLAQTDQSGAGNTQEKTRPTSASSASLPLPVNGSDQTLQPRQAPQQQNQPMPEVLTGYRSDEKIFANDKPEQQQASEASAAQLIASGKEIARLEAEIAQSLQVYSQRLKHRRISASTKSFRDAAYFDAWQRKVERIGNLNYPEEAKHRKLSGSLILEVAIDADGNLHDILILRSSGQKLLDDAAVRIVRLASPFAPLPDAMRKDTDILHITRTWRFMSGNRFSSSN